MNDVLALLFSQQFLVRALVVGVLISLCSALLGVSLVLKRFSMIGDGLSHVAFGAMAIATAASVAPLYFALPIVVVAAFLLLRMSESGKIKGDAAIALISTGSLAVGVLATSMTTGMNVDIYNYMFGSILTMSKGDVVTSSIIALIIITLFVVFYNEIFAVTFDESFAKATGTKVGTYNMLIAALTAVTIVIGMRMMGALLISSLIIFPTVTSMRLCKSFKSVVLSSVIISVFCFVSGLLLSIKIEAPTGASVVVMNIFMLLCFTALKVVSGISENSKASHFRKLIKALVILLCSVVYFAAFTFGETQNDQSKEKPVVVAAAFAEYDFARQIAGDKAEVTMLLSPGEESHTYEPTPGDILKIKECDVFIFGGGESDKWAESILSSVDSDMQIIRMMDTVELYEEATVEGMETDHEHHDHVHEHTEEYDEHVWTSPINAITICESVFEALCEVDESNTEYYNKNLEKYTDEIKKLDSEISHFVVNSPNKCIVIGDRFPLRYFTERYSLTYFAAFPGCSAQVEANPVTVSFLSDKVRNEEIPVVFKTDLSKGEIAKTISDMTGTEVETLYSCHTVSAEDFEKGETYVSLMRRNFEGLKKALQ